MHTIVVFGIPTWLPFIATDVNTGSPRIGITYDQVDVSYKRSNQSSFQVKALVTTDFRENGGGIYEILFSAIDLSEEGLFLYLVNGKAILLPEIKQSIGQADIQRPEPYTPGGIVLATNVLTGNLIDAHGDALIDVAVSARVLEAPEILGSSPNIGGVGTDIISARTDDDGFFALEVLQNSLIDITIPRIGYRRTLRVPANASDSLFRLP